MISAAINFQFLVVMRRAMRPSLSAMLRLESPARDSGRIRGNVRSYRTSRARIALPEPGLVEGELPVPSRALTATPAPMGRICRAVARAVLSDPAKDL